MQPDVQKRGQGYVVTVLAAISVPRDHLDEIRKHIGQKDVDSIHLASTVV